jgi:hypothetical protein
LTARNRQKLAKQKNTASPAPRNGMGSAIMVITLTCALLLAAVGLLLPPFSLGERLWPESGQASGGPAFAANADVAGQLSVEGNGVLLRAQTASNSALPNGLPAGLSQQSRIYKIEYQTTPTAPIGFSAQANTESGANLSLYGYNAEQMRWQFIPATRTGTTLSGIALNAPAFVGIFSALHPAPVVSAVVLPGQALSPEAAAALNVVHPAGLQPIVSGALDGSLPSGIVFDAGYAVVPVIRNFAGAADSAPDTVVAALLQSEAGQRDHIQYLAEFMSTKPYKGLAIDYRNLPSEARESFSAFVGQAGTAIRAAGGALTVVVPFPTFTKEVVVTGAYDWQMIGDAADVVQLLLPANPLIFAPDAELDQVLRWAATQMPIGKLQVAFSAFSQNGAGEAITFADLLAPMGQLAINSTSLTVKPGDEIVVRLTGEVPVFGLDEGINAPYIAYGQQKWWPLSAGVMADRLSRLFPHGVGGVLITDWAANSLPSDLPGLFGQYRLYQTLSQWPVPAQSALRLRWQVRLNGQLLQEQFSSDGLSLRPTSEAELEISADLPDLNLTLGSIRVQVRNP